MNPLVLAIAGRAKAGKDTVADFLIQQDPRYCKAALADNLKNMCRVLFGLSTWHTDTQDGKLAPLDPPIVFDRAAFWAVTKYMDLTHADPLSLIPDARIDFLMHQLPVVVTTARQLLQFVGTEICRGLVDSYHIDVLMSSLTCHPTNNIWIVTDCRFADERRAFKKQENMDTKLIIVRRPEADAVPATHASETSLGEDSAYDHAIQNTGTLEELSNKIQELHTQILSGYR